MFPNSFSARVAERMAVWCALIGFLLLLSGAVEVIQANRMAEILDDRRQATAALMAHVEAQSPGTVVDGAELRARQGDRQADSVDRSSARRRCSTAIGRTSC